ncbi:MAG TPA: chemotaxis-specific protein-glutamate methyltransferase CheB [Gemmatimonadales bacterium]
MKPVRLAIVDDALFIREGLRRLLEGDARITVVGAAASGEEFLARLDEWRPDAVTLDLNMPGLGGLDTLDRLMALRPMPVIILSTRSGDGAPITVEALGRGAADFIDKEAYSLVDFQALREVLIQKLVHVTGNATGNAVASGGEPLPLAPARVGEPRLIVIGASTGGPRAIEMVLSALGAEFPAPIVVVQHMPVGFTRAFAERLDRALPLTVWEARHGDVLGPGMVAIAPADSHVSLRSAGNHLTVILAKDPADALHRPAVDVLFRSAASVTGNRTVGVLLTGMGSDGADGMRALWRCGAHTIAQDEESCVVYGMPRVAVTFGAVRDVLPLSEIGASLRQACAMPTSGATVAP